MPGAILPGGLLPFPKAGSLRLRDAGRFFFFSSFPRLFPAARSLIKKNDLLPQKSRQGF